MHYEKLKVSRMSYILRYPDGYQAGKQYPVLIFLHGAGIRGNDLDQVLNNPFFCEIAGFPEFPFIVAAPQCSENSWFDMLETLKQFVLNVSRQEGFCGFGGGVLEDGGCGSPKRWTGEIYG